MDPTPSPMTPTWASNAARSGFARSALKTPPMGPSLTVSRRSESVLLTRTVTFPPRGRLFGRGHESRARSAPYEPSLRDEILTEQHANANRRTPPVQLGDAQTPTVDAYAGLPESELPRRPSF